MVNDQKRYMDIPRNYNEILEFLGEKKDEIIRDWSLLSKILEILDDLLKQAANMSDLHKDTKIILETIKLQKDTLLKEARNELTFSKILKMANEYALDDFFMRVKSNSLAISFVDSLDFNFSKPKSTERKAKKVYDKADGSAAEPEKLEAISSENQLNSDLIRIKDKVEKNTFIEFFDLVFDFNSFSRTIYNAFNLALAMRTKLVSLKMHEGSLVAVPFCNSYQELDHSVFEITYEEYEKLKKVLKD